MPVFLAVGFMAKVAGVDGMGNPKSSGDHLT
jgi:hypothetical protein